METLPKNFTVESFTELVKQNPDTAYEILKTLSREEKQMLLVEMPRDAYTQIMNRAFMENLETGIRDKAPTR